MPGDDRTPSADGGTGDDGELESVMTGCRSSHEFLVSAVSDFDDAAVRSPSRLEGWTVGHIVTHLARNADSHTRMLKAAARGEAVEQYAGGREERARLIESGAGRSARELLDDTLRSITDLESAWATMTPSAWNRHGLTRGHPWSCRTMPYFRWREVEIHHVDMGTDYGPRDWPEEYVSRELPLLLATVPDRLDDGAQRRGLLAWLTGRSPSVGGDLDLGRWESRPGNYFKGLSS